MKFKLKFFFFLLLNTLVVFGKSNQAYFDPSVEGSELLLQKHTQDKNTYSIFSHAKPGSLIVQGQWLEKEEILSFLQTQISKETQFINIFGCEFAKGKKGLEAVSFLEKNLGVKISASTNITGKDGDWKLEVGSGKTFDEFEKYGFNLQYNPTDDFDGDAKLNNVDLDDDNDGVLDSVEGSADTDGDSMTDSFDLDSDGDGCPDAIETGAGITTANLKRNTSISGTVDANGVPTLANGGIPRGDGANATISNGCLPLGSIGGMGFADDFDGDGNRNDRDPDDDNDGVLDKEECPLGDNFEFQNGWLGLGNGSAQTATNVDISSKMGLPTGSVIVSVTNAYTNGAGISFVKGGQLTTYTISGTVPVYVTVAFTDNTLSPNEKKILIANDGTPYFPDNLAPSPVAYLQNNLTYTTSNTSAASYTSSYGQFRYVSRAPATSFTISKEDGTTTNERVNFYFSPNPLNICTNTNPSTNPNLFNLDSDGDGCSDAVESGAKSNLSSNYVTTIPSGPDSNDNGYLDIYELNPVGPPGQPIGNYLSTYPQYAIKSNMNFCTDNDGDAISNLADIDDDNDGILDAEEAPSCYYTATEMGVPSRVTSEIPTTSTIANLFDNTNTSTFAFTATTAVNALSKTVFEITPIYPIAATSINLQTNAATTSIFGTISATATLKAQGWNGSAWVDLATYTAAPATASNLQTFAFSNSTIYSKYRLFESGTSGVNITAGVLREVSLTTASNYIPSAYSKSTCTVDTDGDGKPNNLDLDSDGDNCPDLVEARHRHRRRWKTQPFRLGF
ncbi:MAG: hypothetical protein C4K58_03200 [Flavobacteriaceae bacterium]|nr:MAG: hypothetical protein C4K58_03200 [Flavobacteriaceae bacterium]